MKLTTTLAATATAASLASARPHQHPSEDDVSRQGPETTQDTGSMDTGQSFQIVKLSPDDCGGSWPAKEKEISHDPARTTMDGQGDSNGRDAHFTSGEGDSDCSCPCANDLSPSQAAWVGVAATIVAVGVPTAICYPIVKRSHSRRELQSEQPEELTQQEGPSSLKSRKQD